jgi:trimethylamine:corrinoid methyltransferase-like protein
MKINTEKILFTQLGDEAVVYDTENNEYVSLNETFFKILKGVEKEQSVDEIVGSLCEEYDISAEDCKSEVIEALNILKEKEFII